MPKRKSFEKVDTNELQGDDSWVKIVRPTWKQTKVYLRMRRETNNNSELSEDDREEKLMDLGEQILTDHVKAWNWVDDDGEPLPQPNEPGAIDLLTTAEITFLNELIATEQPAGKN